MVHIMSYACTTLKIKSRGWFSAVFMVAIGSESFKAALGTYWLAKHDLNVSMTLLNKPMPSKGDIPCHNPYKFSFSHNNQVHQQYVF